jgi:hypothetical protein
VVTDKSNDIIVYGTYNQMFSPYKNGKPKKENEKNNIIKKCE